ncbi:hypothetical protein F4814DRAFT_400328 [Daldinia grandis]|nr:hypothetical protein F4814DRAFT_400328 [Daldinia grandis]
MPPPHRPDIAVYRGLIPIKQWDVNPLMWPYINLEDLSKTEPLLLMLNSRGRYPPSDFTHFDFESVLSGYQTPYYNMVALEGYTMTFREPPSLDTYGRLLLDTDDNIRFADGSRQRGFTPDNGFRILAVQDRLYNFLIKCCEAILHDIPAEDLTHIDRPILPLPPVVVPKRNSLWLRFSSINSLEDLYKRPCYIELSDIESLIKPMLFAAEDHLMSMREDPDYFRMLLIQREENCPETLLDVNGQQHPIFLQDKNMYWARIIRKVFSDAVLIFSFLQITYDSLRSLHRLFNEWKKDPSQTATMPLPVCKALYGLLYSLLYARGKIVERWNLSESVYCSHALRKYFYYSFQDSNKYDSIQVQRRPGVDMPETCAETVYFLEGITSIEKRLPIGFKVTITELELLTQRHPTAKSFVSSWVGAQISFLGVLCNCIYALEQYQPRHQGLSQYVTEYLDEMSNFYNSKFKVVFKVYNIPRLFWYNRAKTMRDILIGESKYPVREPRSREVVEKLRETEAGFDHFWIQALDQLQRARVLEVCVTSIFSRKLQRTEPWIEPQIERAKGETKEMGSKSIDQLSDESTHQKNSETEKFACTTKESADAEMNDSTAEGGDRSPFKVDSRTFEVFSALLFDGPDPSNIGEVS